VFRIPCPHCGPRNLTEFRSVGEVHSRPDPATTTPDEWRGYLYGQRNRADWTTETWYHRAGCRTFLTVERHTVTNDIRSSAVQAGGS
jgi:heterotetrameric sarcosine oxidase delta subunit